MAVLARPLVICSVTDEEGGQETDRFPREAPVLLNLV